jgi:hypothetical protein
MNETRFIRTIKEPGLVQICLSVLYNHLISSRFVSLHYASTLLYFRIYLFVIYKHMVSVSGCLSVLCTHFASFRIIFSVITNMQSPGLIHDLFICTMQTPGPIHDILILQISKSWKRPGTCIVQINKSWIRPGTCIVQISKS